MTSLAKRAPLLIAAAVAVVAGSVFVMNRAEAPAPSAAGQDAAAAVETAAQDAVLADGSEDSSEDSSGDSSETAANDVAAQTTAAVEEAVVEAVETDTANTEAVETPQSFGLEIDVSGVANGTIVIDLFEDVAPAHVEQITALAADGFYDGVVFHRVIDGFMAQTGDGEFGRMGDDLRRAGTGGSTRPNLPAEFSDTLSFTRGVVGMARSQDPNSANSQFFIMFGDGTFLDGEYTIVGEVTDGLDVLDAIKRGEGGNGAVLGQPDMMQAVRVTE